MRILVYSDIHHGVMIGKLGRSGLDLRIEDTLEIEKQITEICKKERIQRVIFCGDRFKSRNPPIWLINLVDRCWVERCREHIVIDALVGNHDSYRVINLGTSYSYLWNGWNGLEGVKIHDRPSIEMIGGLAIGFLPYGSMLKDLSDRVDLLVFHDEVKGYIDDRGYRGREGFDVREIRKVCKFFVSGHIHSFMDVDGFGIVVGAPYQIDTLDIGKRRGVLIIDTDSLKKIEFRELDGIPKLKKMKEEDVVVDEVKGNYVICEVERKNVKNMKKKMEEFGARWFRIEERIGIGIFVDKFAKKIYLEGNPIDMIKEYVSSRNLKDRDRIEELGIEIWRELK